MKKTYRFENLGCANCAAKMEAAIQKLEGVHSVSVNFIAQKLVLEAEDACFADVLTRSAAICKKIEPRCGLQV
ncbi:MAG: heavy-metal-associated domain-containing protein [Oscillospiraceae bacterium]|nr:heavy-metal-associated domain-containing protein [Oscillospiraceae bacterium]